MAAPTLFSDDASLILVQGESGDERQEDNRSSEEEVDLNSNLLAIKCIYNLHDLMDMYFNRDYLQKHVYHYLNSMVICTAIQLWVLRPLAVFKIKML